MVIGVLKFLHLDVYPLNDLGQTLSFVMPYVVMRFDVLLDVLLDHFSVCTPIGNSIAAKGIYKMCPIELLL